LTQDCAKAAEKAVLFLLVKRYNDLRWAERFGKAVIFPRLAAYLWTKGQVGCSSIKGADLTWKTFKKAKPHRARHAAPRGVFSYAKAWRF
jgi:hypothetical protein